MLHIQSILGPPGDMNLGDCFYRLFLLFADSAMLMGFKLGEQVFDNPVVDPVA